MTRPLVGVDLVPLSRVHALLAPDPGTGTEPGAGPLLARLLSAAELVASRTPGGAPDPSGIAGRLAAKEAVFKLLGSVGKPVPWQGIEVLRGPGGRPGVRLSGRAAELARTAGIGPIDVSISHDAGFAIAVAAATATATASVPDRPVPDRPVPDRPVPLDQ